VPLIMVLISIGSLVGPTVAVSVGQYFAPAERPRANALMYNFFHIGSVLAPLVAGYVMGLSGLTGLLFFMGLIGAFAVVMPIVLFILRDRCSRGAIAAEITGSGVF
jgi:MFS family permease